MDNMSILVRYCRTYTERKLKEYDLSFGEQIILMFLSKNENMNQDTIAKTYMIDKSMVAKTLDKLEKKGYVLRKQNPENKRENIISLEQKGYDILCHMRVIHKEWKELLYEGISEEEIKFLNNLTGRMVENVTKYLD